jgi:hypothetical protein
MADGINKIVIAKKETVWGTKPVATAAQLYPRVTGSFQLEKETYASNAIRPSQQVGDSRHGTRKSTGSLEGELQCGAYKEFQAAALRKDYAGTATTGALTTISSTVGTLVRTAGSFITDGFRNGMIITVTGFTAPATANNARYVIVDVIALTLSVRKVDQAAVPMVVKAAGDSVTIALQGKLTFTPQTGHTNDSFSIEEFNSDIPMSRITLGQQVNTMEMSLSPNGMVANTFAFMGKDAEASTAVQYFTSPTAVPATGTMSTADGLCLIAGLGVCTLSSFSMTVDNGITQEAVIACKGIGAKSRGKVKVSGSFTAILLDSTYIEYFNLEQEVSFSLTVNGTDGTTFSIFMPRMKINSATTDDGEKVIILSVNYDALEYVGINAAIEKTTLTLSDSSL